MKRSLYRVADLLVDVGQASVSRDGVQVPLPKLSFDLFIALMDAAPNVLTTDELMKRVWPGLVVSPETVSQRVKLLRDALGDDAKQPRYIAGVRGRGYQLIAPLMGVSEESSEKPDNAAQSRKQHYVRWIALAACASLLIAIALVWHREVATPALDVPATRPTNPASDRSIAVLPFANMSASSENDVMALGIAETLLHRLASLRQIKVIARTSSFAFRNSTEDPREIGRKLNVRYLLEGSVQGDGQRLRVTAQLIDAATSVHIWSMQFDRSRDDVFAVQDEIAVQVARALQVTLDPRLTEQVTGQGTDDFEAYLAFMQARALSATLRIEDLRAAAAQLERSIGRDPRFASAYALLAGTQILLAEYEPAKERQARFEHALERGYELVSKALELDPANADAYVQRGYLHAFTDLAAAEADYHRGLQLQPSNARAFEGLAAVLYQDPKRVPEAERMLNRARELDPLEPRYDVTQAKLLFYGRSDCQGAQALLKSALGKSPLFQPALMLLAELHWVCLSQFAQAIDYGEQAFALDSHSDWTGRVLVRMYLDVEDVAAAESIVRQSSEPTRWLPFYVHRYDWRRAAAAAERMLVEQSGAVEIEQQLLSVALRKQARVQGKYDHAIKLFEQWSGVTWDQRGAPVLVQQLGMRTAEVGLADMLLQSGDRRRGRALLEAVLAQIEYETRELGRGGVWYLHARLGAMALLGETEGALTDLERSLPAAGGFHGWLRFEIDPAYDSIRRDQRFTRCIEKVRAHAATEYVRVQALRTQGRIPKRGAA